MNNKPNFDNLPSLSKEESLSILAKPIEDLILSSDYYKAVYHLSKYPCIETEKALISLLESNSSEHCVVIARRKAVEVLAQINCVKAILPIGICLQSDDPYLISNCVWALKELKCDDNSLIEKIWNLLDDPNQDRRTIIKSLASLGSCLYLNKIIELINNCSNPPSIRGAAISALAMLSGDTSRLSDLENHLFLLNQNDRQCAVQDIIDSEAINLLNSVIKSPVAISFKLRAIESLWPGDMDSDSENKLFAILDSVIIDCPENISILHNYNEEPDIKFLVEQLFNTDVSRCYLALRTLINRAVEDIWPILSLYMEKAKKDYGAIYFFILLFRSLDGWGGEALEEIKKLLLSALDSKWPEYMKFRPAAILTIMTIDYSLALKYIDNWLSETSTPFWASRYAALIMIDRELEKDPSIDGIKEILVCRDDSHRFVRYRSKRIIRKFK